MDASETRLLGALLIAACVAAMVLVFFIISIIRYHRKNMLLYKEKISWGIESMEKERSRIAADLHDHLGPMLSAVKLQASVLEARNSNDEEVIKSLNIYVDAIMDSIRTISNDLRPNVLDRLGLYKGIEDLVSSLNTTGPLRFSLSGKEGTIPVPKDIELHVYRIVQEILNNAIKHAEATEVKLTIEAKGQRMTVAVADNGKGFDFAAEIIACNGSGLRNILSRAEVLRASVAVNAQPGAGTEYTLDIPIHYDQRKHQSSDS